MMSRSIASALPMSFVNVHSSPIAFMIFCFRFALRTPDAATLKLRAKPAPGFGPISRQSLRTGYAMLSVLCRLSYLC